MRFARLFALTIVLIWTVAPLPAFAQDIKSVSMISLADRSNPWTITL